MDIVVPYRPTNPKTRLAPALSLEEREAFSAAMLADVVDVIREAGHRPVVLSTAGAPVDAPTITSPASLSDAVNEVLTTRQPPVAVVMADLALATPAAIERLTDGSADVTLAPGRRGGTNAFVARVDGFRVDYHGVSYRDHRRIARERDLAVEAVDSARLATDVDVPTDLVEVLLHGEGRARHFLADRFRLADDENGVRVVRDGPTPTAPVESDAAARPERTDDRQM